MAFCKIRVDWNSKKTILYLHSGYLLGFGHVGISRKLQMSAQSWAPHKTSLAIEHKGPGMTCRLVR
jgi:hypothetical protein